MIGEPPIILYIYIYIYIYENYNRNYLQKLIENRKILMNKMCLEFNVTYAVQILLGSVNIYVTA